MKKITKIKILLAIFTIGFIGAVLCFFNPITNTDIDFNMCVSVKEKSEIQVYFCKDEETGFSEQMSIKQEVLDEKKNDISFEIPSDITYIRIDFGTECQNVTIDKIRFGIDKKEITINDKYLKNPNGTNDIEIEKIADGYISVIALNQDPYIVYDFRDLNVENEINQALNYRNILAKGIVVFGVLLLFVYAYRKIEFLWEFPAEILHSKKLILQLSKNDFKTKYAGSYLGIVWAFVQPVITVLVYWFVFEKGLKAGGVSEIPFVLWLIAGLVPWFFFSDSLNGGTNALIEYQYLVKKVVFKIDILPIVKVLSALYVHAFFVVFTLILFACYGYLPDLYALQLIYYTFCVCMLVIGLCYLTSSVVGFFRDLTQIIGIILQVGIWMTPIMWNLEGMGLPGWLVFIFKLNPMYYIVAGYRDSLIDKVWFFEKSGITIYFWIVTLFILCFGANVFKKLKTHFADVL